MPELNKFLDLEGLKVFWDQINKKKQNRTIQYNGKEMLLEDCLNEIKKEIENVQNEIGNIEELDLINQRIEEIKNTLQEIDNEIDNLNENYVPESRTVAGINLENDIKASSLGTKLTTYSIYHHQDYGDGQDYEGRISIIRTGSPNWDFDKAYILGAIQSGATTWYKLLTDKDINVKVGENKQTAKLVSQNLLNEELNHIKEQQLSEEDILQLITTYPVLIGTTIPEGSTIGKINQLYINENTGLFYICYSISNPETSPYYNWRQIKVNTDHIVSSVSSSSTDLEAPSAKLFYNTTQVLNGGIDERNLSNTFYDAGAIQNTNAIWPGTTDYFIGGSYEILGQTCTLNIGIKIKSGYEEMWYPLPIMPHSTTNQYSLIYTHDSNNVLYLVSVGDQKPSDAPTEYPHLLHVKRADGKAITQDDELHLIFSYRIR